MPQPLFGGGITIGLRVGLGKVLNFLKIVSSSFAFFSVISVQE
jgi:hypothetical protein